MSELVLTNQGSPGALGSGISAFFFSVGGLPSYVGNDGIVYSLTGMDGNGAFSFNGALSVGGNINVSSNNTASVGNVTMNGVITGRVNVGIGVTQLTVTSNMVTANSHVFAQAAANDSTGRVNSVVPAAGSFAINCTGPAANMAVNFWIVNIKP
jgi:hypothetical protein